MQINKKRLIFYNRDLLINHPIIKRCFLEGCEKCNNYPSLDENRCSLCYRRLFENDD